MIDATILKKLEDIEKRIGDLRKEERELIARMEHLAILVDRLREHIEVLAKDK